MKNFNVLLLLFMRVVSSIAWDEDLPQMTPQVEDIAKDQAALLKLNAAMERVVTDAGYRFEAHHTDVVNWRLTLHRIYKNVPNNNNNPNTKRVAFLQHGLLDTSGAWISTGVGNGLAYVLADAGFDVWMGNNRGNIFSSGRGKQCPQEDTNGEHPSICKFSKRWAFSYDDHALIDVRAMLKKATDIRGNKKIDIYIGHSMGGVEFALLFSGLKEGSRWARADEELQGVRPFTLVEVDHFIGLSPAIFTPLISRTLYKMIPEVFWKASYTSKTALMLNPMVYFSHTDSSRSLKTKAVGATVRGVTKMIHSRPVRALAGNQSLAKHLMQPIFCRIAGCASASQSWIQHIKDVTRFAPGATSLPVLRTFRSNDLRSRQLLLQWKGGRGNRPLDTCPQMINWDYQPPKRKNSILQTAKNEISKMKEKKKQQQSNQEQPSLQEAVVQGEIKNSKQNREIVEDNRMSSNEAMYFIAPPEYDFCNIITKMKTKIHLFTSDFDPLVRPNGVKLFALKLKSCNEQEAVSRIRFVHTENFGHVDFTFGSHADCNGRMDDEDENVRNEWREMMERDGFQLDVTPIQTSKCQNSINFEVQRIVNGEFDQDIRGAQQQV